MRKSLRYIVLLFLFVLLFLVRAFETDLFYDPLIPYFQNDYLYKEIPEMNKWKLLTGMVFRYALNSLLSLAILYFMFRNYSFLKIASISYGIFLIVFMSIFGCLLAYDFSIGYLLPFYIRRFLIHPMLLLVFLPLFYYRYHQKINL